MRSTVRADGSLPGEWMRLQILLPLPSLPVTRRCHHHDADDQSSHCPIQRIGPIRFDRRHTEALVHNSMLYCARLLIIQSSAVSRPEVEPIPSEFSTRTLMRFAAGAMPVYLPHETTPFPAAIEATWVPCP